MKKLALLLGLVICTIAASTAYATTRDHGSPPPLAHPGQVLIESEPGVYIVAPRSVQETTSAATAGGGAGTNSVVRRMRSFVLERS